MYFLKTSIKNTDIVGINLGSVRSFYCQEDSLSFDIVFRYNAPDWEIFEYKTAKERDTDFARLCHLAAAGFRCGDQNEIR